MNKIKRALVSCTDKSGLVEFVKFLVSEGVEILSTGGTAKLLRDNGLSVKDVSEYTGFPEIMNGRVKTLHPKVHGGLLALRDNSDHQKQMQQNDIQDIDMVVVNLYAFEDTVAKPDVTLEDAIENIDIGGPSMLRSAAKNYKSVTVVTDPKDYPCLQDEIKDKGNTSLETRKKLAVKVFGKTANYDQAIFNYLSAQDEKENKLREQISISLEKVQDLRYGENPHQKAAFYNVKGSTYEGFAAAKQLQGKELSFNNILDTEAAYQCCAEFKDIACVIVKHNNPCGVAVSNTLSDAFLKARAGDPVSSFGGIVALNRKVDGETALIMAETFFEVIIAPGYEKEAFDIFSRKKNLRLLELSNFGARDADSLDIRFVNGGVLVQDRDLEMVDLSTCPVPTKRKPTAEELEALKFVWRVGKHVKSNAIVFGKGQQVLGVGAGQMSRVDSVKLAAMKAKEHFKSEDVLKGAVVASDAFFPFRDNIDQMAKHGIAAIVQPGGSVRDQEVIDACDEYNMAMVFSGMRHFKH